VADTARCTKLGDIATVEHLMAALAGLEVTDAEIEVDAPELPALDGSALEYVRAVRDAGFADLESREGNAPFTRVFVHDLDRKIAISSGEGHWRYEYRTPFWPYFQVFGSKNVAGAFCDEIAPARTFGHAHEVEAIRAAGLAKGLTLDSALVLGEKGYENPPRFANEASRHKLLDAIGDLYLAGIPIRYLNVVAQGTGHKMNVEAAAQLLEAAANL
jgi:UDP-3-O-[3-hydroxymyristoyl] N-acetylglucosamine deacetylase